MANGQEDRASSENIDVAVVGGGVAGAYTCWRLKEAGRNPVLFEKGDRIGGRLWSLKPPGMPNLVAELGGMRFLTTHELVVSLAEKLALRTDKFPTGGDENLAFLRGRRLRLSDFKQNPEKIPYKLRHTEEFMKPGELLVRSIQKAVPHADAISPQVWEEVKKTATFKGRRLCDWGLWNMLLESSVLSSEAYALLLEGGGYESLADNWNFAEACQYLLSDFPSGVEYRRFTDGFQQLPKTLVAQFQHSGGEVRMKHSLKAFHVASDGSAVDLTLFDEKEKRQIAVTAKALVLAMPQYPLRTLAQTSPPFQDPDVLDLLNSVSAMPAFKMVFGFHTPWWEPMGIIAGRSTTDLPIRQVYYAGTEKGRGDTGNENSLLLASYADGRTRSFWSGLQTTDRRGVLKDPHLLDEKYATADDVGPRASLALVAEATAQLSEMHHPTHVVRPYWSSYADWTSGYGGGWHFWNAGFSVGDRIAKARQPNPSVPVYVCGEAYANEQGWVEGTLKSAEHVLQEHFGLKAPEWIPPNYFLGA